MTPLTITASPTPAALVLEVAGDLDHTNAQQLRRAAREAALPAGHLLAVDLGKLAFCDSSGITALIAVRNHVVSVGAQVVLVDVSANMRRLLDMTGLDQVFDIRDVA
ncbi:STAS domain-containing protein [Streptomyces sp. NPDC126497]|uniref:STAS domain-containing protein n=1 Tax=Streptomyces sp. NPDC126497 TaxID=3155313 RepID=UPI00332B1B65